MRSKISSIATGALAFLVPVIAFGQQLNNPTKFNDIPSFLAAFLKAVVQICLPILTLWIVYAGFLFVVARGNPGKLADAKRNLVYVLIGAFFVLGAWMLATLLGATVSNVVGT
ncbi:MAG TPA: hypothetical protein VMU25_01665 [Candidatus Paceibacterota bacterium]|nr:hypothetical protein [Candidatus Paceibacterota bacterium]